MDKKPKYRTFVKFDEVVTLLNQGHEIWTKSNGAPYRPIIYHIHVHGDLKRIHPMTIEKLIRENVVNGRGVQFDKYKLKIQEL